MKEFDAVCIAIGAMKPRDLSIEGRELKGIHYAMDFLSQQKEIIAAFKSFDLSPDLWSAIKEEKLRDRILSAIEAKEWKKARQLIEKETSSMGEYWQFLALQEAYGKIYPK